MSQMTGNTTATTKDFQVDDGPTIHTTKYETKVPSLHKTYILIISFLVAFFSVANPLLTHLANPLQNQNLYIGMMLTKGQIPYSDIFTTGGMLYFVLIALSYYLGSTWWLVFMEVVAFYIAGIYFYKLVQFVTTNCKVALAFTMLYFILLASLGFGGIYPIQFAMPFVLLPLWFLTKYFAGLTKDEAFILFGITAALSMLLEPRTLVFWFLVTIAIICYNCKLRHFARGFYQLLAIILGLLLVFYVVGYFILNLQILSPYLSQAVLYQFSYFRVGDLPVFLSFLVYLGFLGALGFFYSFSSPTKRSEEQIDTYIKYPLLATIITYLIIAGLSGDYYPYHLLPLLPFSLILIAIPFGQLYLTSQRTRGHRRVRRQPNGLLAIINLYFKKNYYLPIIVITLSLTLAIQQYRYQSHLNQGRQEVVSYIKEHIAKSDKIYVWDSSSQIYLESQRKAASQFASPSVNVKKVAHKRILIDELLQNRAQYIIVNKNCPLPKTLKKQLKRDYRLITKTDITSFHIYQQK
ncbi:DUF2079 domain-containing protein [Streptococcus porcinus]|uniref:DUF2079 domain-containing protein n=1 Tax=Streptococcus porcinus TaxID=1340 RepID=UPI000B8B0752|nr:DUF2079 domain-containing protein [Streptococcus porcinus]VTT48067.1 membrane protein [Streptococcus porcinus]